MFYLVLNEGSLKDDDFGKYYVGSTKWSQNQRKRKKNAKQRLK